MELAMIPENLSSQAWPKSPVPAALTHHLRSFGGGEGTFFPCTHWNFQATDLNLGEEYIRPKQTNTKNKQKFPQNLTQCYSFDFEVCSQSTFSPPSGAFLCVFYTPCPVFLIAFNIIGKSASTTYSSR